MFFQQPSESPYDLRFSLLGFRTRIAWGFWLIAVLLGYNLARDVDWMFRGDSPGTLPLLVIWAGCIAASILIHELGHTIAFRAFGIDASILLYHFGGLAIPTGTRHAFYQIGRPGSLNHVQELIVAAAGPALQIGSALLLTAGVWWFGYRIDAYWLMPGPIADATAPLHSDALLQPSATGFAVVNFYVLPSILWGLLNLVPVLPLDGGRIAQSLIGLCGGDTLQARWLGVIMAIIIAVYAFRAGQHYLAIFFVWMGIENYQATQAGSSWR